MSLGVSQWDLNYLLDFPPGGTVALQSALAHHSNISIAKDEIRYSFPQYPVGSLFRCVDGGFKPVPKKSKKTSSTKYQK